MSFSTERSAIESTERNLDNVGSISGLIEAVRGPLPSSAVENLHVPQVFVLLAPEAGGGHAPHHRQLTIDSGHGVTPPAA